jgi:hypothetical protein
MAQTSKKTLKRAGQVSLAVLVVLSLVAFVVVDTAPPQWASALSQQYTFYLASMSPHVWNCTVVGQVLGPDGSATLQFYQVWEAIIPDLCANSLVTQTVDSWVAGVPPYQHECWVLGVAVCPTTISIVANLTAGSDYWTYVDTVDALRFLGPLIFGVSLLALIIWVSLDVVGWLEKRGVKKGTVVAV